MQSVPAFFAFKQADAGNFESGYAERWRTREGKISEEICEQEAFSAEGFAGGEDFAPRADGVRKFESAAPPVRVTMSSHSDAWGGGDSG